MAKALLVNGAVDMGTADIPNNNEGWGRVDITRVIQPAVAVVHLDQLSILTGTGQQVIRHFEIDDPGEPLRVTLAWSDAPGAAGANPALVNNLDLESSTTPRPIAATSSPAAPRFLAASPTA